uniref:Cytochrome P450 n=1 Tax=Latimeria chalumnae TaxID=7897 RepID=M3XK02_LATCH|nr:PREDICTED: cytochrome P450 3A27-like [Latimeria chalumnae]|eukprot:XP_014342333.1 PREDICTED: cytochrome P450 3A27-like [Latimeria chalumnae]
MLSVESCALIVVVLTLLILYGIKPYGFFKKLGIPGPRPLPYIGTLLHYRKGWLNFDMECFKKYGKIWGIYDGRVPIFCITDTGMIKTILIKECYSLFTNRRKIGPSGPLKDALGNTDDEHWKKMRSVLSPVFTSGKLKEMFPIIKQYAGILLKSIQKKVKMDQSVDTKEIFGAYSMDVVTSTSFSIDVDSLSNPKDPFITNIRKLLDFNLLSPILILSVVFPAVVTFLEKISVNNLSADSLNFFYDSFRKIKNEREKGMHMDRIDFLQLMIDSQISKDSSEPNGNDHSYKALTDSEVLAQSVVFVFAGYETTSSSLSFLAYNLATHLDVQKQLQEEIDEVFPNKAPMTYDGLMHMEYLDMVINESLRLFPPAGRLDRVCKKSVEINGITIPQGAVVQIPIFVLHHDPALWPDPEEFRPERFNKKNKESQDPYSYLPFGAGPRNCIGMRFALLSMKVALVSILQSFIVYEETQVPLELESKFLLSTKKPIVIKLKPRNPTEIEE